MSLIVTLGQVATAGLNVVDRRLVLSPPLVHALDYLKRQHDIAYLGRLVGPDELDLALVIEQDNVVMILQGLISVEKTKDVGPFGVGGFRHGRRSHAGMTIGALEHGL